MQRNILINPTAHNPRITDIAIFPPLLSFSSLETITGTTTARASRMAEDGIAAPPIEVSVSVGMNIVGAITTSSSTEVIVSAGIRSYGLMSVTDLSFNATLGLESEFAMREDPGLQWVCV